MSVESLCLSPVEKELLFTRWCQQRSINIALLDFDDTICITGKVFRKQMNQAYDHLATQTPTPRGDWEETITTINDRLFERMGVNPVRWDRLTNLLARFHRRYRNFDLPVDTQCSLKQIFGEIYTTPSDFLPGAENGLSFLAKTGLPIGIVTHANRPWTWRKYNWLGLERFLPWDAVYIVDENGHKTPESWAQAISYFGQKSQHCLVIGNSPRSDINPAIAAGVRPENCILVEGQALWSVHDQLVDPRVRRIKNLSQLADIRIESLPQFRPRQKSPQVIGPF